MAYEMMLYPKEKTPQTVPAGSYCSDVYAPYADLFDLSLVPNDGEVPLSPQSQLQQCHQASYAGPAPSPDYIPATIFHDVPAGPVHQMKQEQPSAAWTDSWSGSSGYGSCGSSIASSNPASPESTASSYGLLDHPHQHQSLQSVQGGGVGGGGQLYLGAYELDQPIKLEYDSGAETSIDLDSLLGDAPSPYQHVSSPPAALSPALVKVEHGHQLPEQEQASARPQGFQILREHLQDTSFQRRHNLKPLELDSLIGGLTTHADIGPVFEFALQEMKNGVQATCTELGISSDPKQWSTAKVHQWLELAMGKYFLPRLDNLGALFPENGAQLAALPLDEFVRRIPQGGDKLHGYLELWKQIHRLMVGDNATVDSMVVHTDPGSVAAAGGLLSLSPMGAAPLGAVQPGFSGLPSEGMIGGAAMLEAVGGTLGAGPSSGPTSTHSTSPSMLDNFDSDSMNGDVSDDDDEDMPLESPGSSSSTGGGVPTAQAAGGGTGLPVPPAVPAVVKPRHGGSHIHLWQFLKELLASPEQHQNAIRWIDRSKGVFKIEDSVRVARLWGRRKNRPAMNYDKLSRSIRQYYKKGIMQKTERSQRLVYQFCSPYAL